MSVARHVAGGVPCGGWASPAFVLSGFSVPPGVLPGAFGRSEACVTPGRARDAEGERAHTAFRLGGWGPCEG